MSDWSSDVCSSDLPGAPAPKKLICYFQPLKTADAWWLMAFYSVTFGGFVGLAASLPIYFTDQFHLTPVMAGYCTAACVFAGSLVRPMGGALADKLGGVRSEQHTSELQSLMRMPYAVFCLHTLKYM